MNSLHTVRKSLVIALAVLGLGSAGFAAQAQTQAAATSQAQEGRHGNAASKEERQAKWAARSAKRQAELKASLKLTPAQEPAWAAFSAAAKPQVRGERRERGEWAKLSAPARMEKRLAMSKEHIAAMETRLAALNSFYAVLTPEQKKVLDDASMRGGRGMGHGRHGGHRGHHGQPAMQS